MSWEDFAANFDKVDICTLGDDVAKDVADMTGVQVSQAVAPMQSVHYDGKLEAGVNSGGSRPVGSAS